MTEERHVNVYWISPTEYITGVPHSPDMCRDSCKNPVACDANGKLLEPIRPPTVVPASRTRPIGTVRQP